MSGVKVEADAHPDHEERPCGPDKPSFYLPLGPSARNWPKKSIVSLCNCKSRSVAMETDRKRYLSGFLMASSLSCNDISQGSVSRVCVCACVCNGQQERHAYLAVYTGQ